MSLQEEYVTYSLKYSLPNQELKISEEKQEARAARTAKLDVKKILKIPKKKRVRKGKKKGMKSIKHMRRIPQRMGKKSINREFDITDHRFLRNKTSERVDQILTKKWL